MRIIRILSMIITAGIILGLTSSCSFNFDRNASIGKLASGGKTDYKIVIPASPSKQEDYAASELAKYLKMITGAEFETVKDSEDESSHEIILGSAERSDNETDLSALGVDGFRIKTFGGSAEKIVISSPGRGVIYGVYEFLEKYCGCRFYAEDCEYIPDDPELGVVEIDDIQKPSFESRTHLWSCGFTDDYKMKRKLSTEDDSIAGGISYTKSLGVHSYYKVVSPDEYFDTHPEYFSMNSEGERFADVATHSGQLCLSNPEVTEIAIEKIREILTENPGEQICSITQNDNYDYCRCEECEKIYKEEGTLGGTNIRFINAIAEALGDEFPDVRFDTFAYLYSLVPPKVTVPRDNVIIRLCSIKCCCAHDLGIHCNINTGLYANDNNLEIYYDEDVYSTFDDCIRGWAQICNNMYVWHYTTDFSYYIAPFPNLFQLRDDAYYFSNMNVTGLFMQGNYQTVSCDLAELRLYLISKVLWNANISDTEYKELIDDFLEGYYGAAAPYIKDYIYSLEENKTHFSCYSGIEDDLFPYKYLSDENDPYIVRLDMTYVNGLKELFNKALEATEGTEYYDRTLKASLPIEYVRLVLLNKDLNLFRQNNQQLLSNGSDITELKEEYENARTGFIADSEKLYDNIVYFGVGRLKEGGSGLPEKEKINFEKSTWLTDFD